jgi:ubiquinol-cytochrome c reductase cytochrome b subunit
MSKSISIKSIISRYIINIIIDHRSKVHNLVGPYNNDIISIIYGSLLGDAFAERRKGGKGTRICFYQEGSHKDYLLYLHSLIANLGYCNTNIPKIKPRLGVNGKIRYIIRFSTWTYTTFNWILDDWYVNGVKKIPRSLKYYLTPLALAIWIMDDGGKVGSGLKLLTNCFDLNDLEFLISLLKDKYDLHSSIQSAGVDNQYFIYIWAESMPKLVEIVRPYIIPSMKYKFGKYI